MLIPILSLVLAAPAPEPPAALPKGPPPKVMVADGTRDGHLFMRLNVRLPKAVPEQVTVLVNGQLQVQTRQITVTTIEPRAVDLDSELATVYDSDGKKIEPRNLPKRTEPFPVLLSADGQEVDPFYLQLVRPGTLIVVAPALAGATPIGDPPSVPKPGNTIKGLRP